jgi:hypothetical protein
MDRNEGEIHFAPDHDAVSTLCHELGHFLSFDKHGPVFRGMVIELVRLMSSNHDAERLRDSYLQAGLELGKVRRSAEAGFAMSLLEQQHLHTPHLASVLQLLDEAEDAIPAVARTLRTQARSLMAKTGGARSKITAERCRDTKAVLIAKRVRIEPGPYSGTSTDLLRVLARGRCCVSMWYSDRQGIMAVVFGAQGDVADVLALFSAIDSQGLRDMLKVPSGKNTQMSRRIWHYGFVAGITEVLEREKEDQELRTVRASAGPPEYRALKRLHKRARERRAAPFGDLRTDPKAMRGYGQAFLGGWEAGLKTAIGGALAHPDATQPASNQQ